MIKDYWQFLSSKIKLEASYTIQKSNQMESLFDPQLISTITEIHHNYLLPISSLLAQTIEDPDILGQIQDAWYNFIDSGQVWALLFGMFFGYTFKGFTG